MFFISFSTNRSYENRLMHPIWFSPVGFPGSFTHYSTTLHDSVYSAFHCSSSAVGCFWKDCLWRGGLKTLFCFCVCPPLPPLLRVSHMWPHLCWKTSKRSSHSSQRSAHHGSSQEAQEHLWGNGKKFLWCHWIPLVIHTANLPPPCLLCWLCKCRLLGLNKTIIKSLPMAQQESSQGFKIIVHHFHWVR